MHFFDLGSRARAWGLGAWQFWLWAVFFSPDGGGRGACLGPDMGA